MGIKVVATGSLGGSDLMSVSSAIACVPDVSGSLCMGTMVALTLGPGMMYCIKLNVELSVCDSGASPCEALTYVVAE